MVSTWFWFGLTNLSGYYARNEVFNTEGDFTTSVEISQFFPELIALFFVNLWDKTGKLNDVKKLMINLILTNF
jgi:SAM-dependent MidA family methyltransferase